MMQRQRGSATRGGAGVPGTPGTTGPGWRRLMPAPLRRLTPASAVLGGIWVLILLVFAVIFGLPLLWLILAPTKTDAEVVNWSPISFGSFAQVGTAWSNLMSYNNREILTWLWNSLFYSAGALILVIVLCLTAGYALGTVKFKGRSTILLITLIAMIIPASAWCCPSSLRSTRCTCRTRHGP